MYCKYTEKLYSKEKADFQYFIFDLEVRLQHQF